MRVASRWRNARSCVTNMTAPSYSARKLSSHCDRLDVEMVGRLVEQQQIAAGRRARAPAARAAAIRPTACRRSRPPAARAATGSARRDARAARPRPLRDGACALRRRRRTPIGARRAGRPARAARSRIDGWRHTVPASGGISPLRIFSSVDLPVPLRPITDTRSRGVDLHGDVVEQRQMTEGDRHAVQGHQRHPLNVPHFSYHRMQAGDRMRRSSFVRHRHARRSPPRSPRSRA